MKNPELHVNLRYQNTKGQNKKYNQGDDVKSFFIWLFSFVTAGWKDTTEHRGLIFIMRLIS